MTSSVQQPSAPVRPERPGRGTDGRGTETEAELRLQVAQLRSALATIEEITKRPFDGAVMSNDRYAEGFTVGEEHAFARVRDALRDTTDIDQAVTVRHRESLADTGDAYMVVKSRWVLGCLWCNHTTRGYTKGAAIEQMQAHYDDVLPGERVRIS